MDDDEDLAILCMFIYCTNIEIVEIEDEILPQEEIESSRRMQRRKLNFDSDDDEAPPVIPPKVIHIEDRPNDPAVYKRPPLGQYITITDEFGCHVYVSMKSQRAWNTKCKELNAHSSIGIIKQPIAEIIESVANASVRSHYGEISGNRLLSADRVKQSHQSLYVDKYAPKSFRDLLSPEYINREMMKWLLQWEHFVKNEKKPKQPQKIFSQQSQPQKSSQNTPKKEKTPKSKFNFNYKSPFKFHNDRLYPIALLAGPPGSGKTTLAHIVANHAGFRAEEINASEERTGDILFQKIKTACQVPSFFDPRPALIIVDEIDGALGGDRSSIAKLVELAKAVLSNETYGDESKKKKKKKFKLSHPVICICNNLYAPILRDLRSVSQIFNFAYPTSTALSNRIRHVCRGEHISIDGSALDFLLSATGNDIRSTINSLQFIKSRHLSLAIVRKLREQGVVGAKDVKQNLKDVWDALFHYERSKDSILGKRSSDGKQHITNIDELRIRYMANMIYSLSEDNTCYSYWQLLTVQRKHLALFATMIVK